MHTAEQFKYVVRIWNEAGIPCEERRLSAKAAALSFAKGSAQRNAFLASVFYDGLVIARFDHRQTARLHTP